MLKMMSSGFFLPLALMISTYSADIRAYTFTDWVNQCTDLRLGQAANFDFSKLNLTTEESEMLLACIAYSRGIFDSLTYPGESGSFRGKISKCFPDIDAYWSFLIDIQQNYESKAPAQEGARLGQQRAGWMITFLLKKKCHSTKTTH